MFFLVVHFGEGGNPVCAWALYLSLYHPPASWQRAEPLLQDRLEQGCYRTDGLDRCSSPGRPRRAKRSTVHAGVCQVIQNQLYIYINRYLDIYSYLCRYTGIPVYCKPSISYVYHGCFFWDNMFLGGVEASGGIRVLPQKRDLYTLTRMDATNSPCSLGPRSSSS